MRRAVGIWSGRLAPCRWDLDRAACAVPLGLVRPAMAAEEKPEQDHLAHVRLRAPQQHASALDVPAAAAVDELFSANVRLRTSYPQSLATFSAVARENVLDAAAEYTRRYLPEVDDGSAGISADRIVMAGHQPTLFHPGVWYKNFRLDALSKRFDATAINLVVDNDLLATPTVGCPQQDNQGLAAIGLLQMDKPAAPAPHEHRGILDRTLFEAFGQNAAQAIAPTVGDPVIRSLWPEVMAAREILGDLSLGHVLAAGRHRWEWALGLRTLEVPVSHVAGTIAFGSFAGGIFTDIENFHGIYNRVLTRYRKAHGIRSKAHPVPELTRDGQWWESPFWIWTDRDPVRRALFVKVKDGHFHLSDLNQFGQSVAIENFFQWWADHVKRRRVCIAPRALTTTMFGRLLVSDLFIHGIGGAKYDQLTDQIISEFFGVSPPGYLTSTATFSLPFAQPRVTKRDITQRRSRLREYQFHPQRHVASSAAMDTLKRKKRAAIKELKSGKSRKIAHDKIEAINGQLAQTLHAQTAAVELEIEQLKSQLRNSQILHSREYSFALHPKSIVEELKSLARC